VADQRLRLKIAYALGGAGGAASVGALRQALGDPAVAAYAGDALRRMAGRGVAGARAAFDEYDGPPLPERLPPPLP
jgi:hypothetical protein